MQSVEAIRNDMQGKWLYYRNMKQSKHFVDMLKERGIRQDWINRAIETPDSKKEYDDGTCHYIKQIPEYDNRWLRVIVNISTSPAILVTAFFDRRLR